MRDYIYFLAYHCGGFSVKHKIHQGFRKCWEILRSRSVALSLLVCVVMLVFFKFLTGLNLYMIFDGDELSDYQGSASNAGSGVQIRRDDFIFLPDAPQDGVTEIQIERSDRKSVV